VNKLNAMASASEDAAEQVAHQAADAEDAGAGASEDEAPDDAGGGDGGGGGGEDAAGDADGAGAAAEEADAAAAAEEDAVEAAPADVPPRRALLARQLGDAGILSATKAARCAINAQRSNVACALEGGPSAGLGWARHLRSLESVGLEELASAASAAQRGVADFLALGADAHADHCCLCFDAGNVIARLRANADPPVDGSIAAALAALGTTLGGTSAAAALREAAGVALPLLLPTAAFCAPEAPGPSLADFVSATCRVAAGAGAGANCAGRERNLRAAVLVCLAAAKGGHPVLAFFDAAAEPPPDDALIAAALAAAAHGDAALLASCASALQEATAPRGPSTWCDELAAIEALAVGGDDEGAPLPVAPIAAQGAAAPLAASSREYWRQRPWRLDDAWMPPAHMQTIVECALALASAGGLAIDGAEVAVAPAEIFAQLLGLAAVRRGALAQVCATAARMCGAAAVRAALGGGEMEECEAALAAIARLEKMWE
jgi:hypothetical protein